MSSPDPEQTTKPKEFIEQQAVIKVTVRSPEGAVSNEKNFVISEDTGRD